MFVVALLLYSSSPWRTASWAKGLTHRQNHHNHHHHAEAIKGVLYYELEPTPMTRLNPDRKWHNSALAESMMLPSVGSDIAYDGKGHLVGLTDASPHFGIHCPTFDGGLQDNITGEDGITPLPLNGGKRKAKWLPFPDMAPAMVTLSLEGSLSLEDDLQHHHHHHHDTALRMSFHSVATLTGTSGYKTTTRSPPLRQSPPPKFVVDKSCTTLVGDDPGGVDSEGIAGPLADGSFIIGEEYAPSLLHVSSSGKIKKRYTPRNVELRDAYYTVRPILPRVVGVHMRPNRGFESSFQLPGVSGDMQACGIMQSPLGPKKHTKIVRICCVSLENDTLTGVYLLRLDHRKRMINSASTISSHEFIMLERHKGEGNIYKVDIRSATNVVDHELMDTLAFEDPDFDFEEAGIAILEKRSIFSYPNDYLDKRGIDLGTKLEGVTHIRNDTIVLVNDNDYGKHGHNPSIAFIIQFERAFT